MKHWTLRGTTAVAALLFAQAAMADVTPEDIWQSWQNQYSAVGQPVTAESVGRDGDTLIIKGVKATGTSPLNKSESLIPELRMKDLGDGTVQITMTGDMTVTSDTPAADGVSAMKMDATVKLPGMVTTASGTPDAISYDYKTPKADIVINVAREDGNSDIVSFKMGDVSGKYLIAGPKDAMTIDGSLAAGSAAVSMDFTDDTSTVKAAMNAADLSATVKGNFSDVAVEKLNEALAKGLDVNMALAYGATSYEFEIVDESGPGKIIGGSEGGNFSLAVDKTRMMIAGGGKNVALTLSGMGMPFPEAKISYAESGFNLTMPTSKSDTPSDFVFLTKLVDLQMSDAVWGIMDPTGQLPHDAATLVIDTKGTARLTTDLMDDAAMTALGDAAPGELHSLDVTEIKLSAAGAELTGAGAFTFDNTDMTTFAGMPTPTGKLEMKLFGGNTLMDKMVAMGVLTQDEVMGARMMMAMFANTVDGKDEITSVIEAKDKHLYVNGQKIQ